MALLLPEPWSSVISPSGQPIAGATAYFYQTGTLTPQTVYADAGLTMPLTQPLTADSSGRFPSCYLNDGLTTEYRMQVFDAASPPNLLRDIDPLNPQSANAGGLATVTNIAALRAGSFTSGAIFVDGYYNPGDAGRGWFAYAPSDLSSTDNGGTVIVDSAGHRFYRVVFGPVSIDCFGAKQDSGTTDNATYINAALAACAEVVIPGSPGAAAFYAFGSTLQVRSQSRLTGQGRSSYLKALPSFGTTTPLVSNYTTSPASGGSRDDGIVIENLTIDANSQGLANVAMTATQNFHLRRLWLFAPGTDGVLLQAKATDPTLFPQNGFLEDLYVSAGVRHGINITSGVEISVSTPVVDTMSGNGINCVAASSSSLGRNIKIAGAIVRNCGSSTSSAGIYFDANGSVTWTEMSVLGATVDSQVGNGIYAKGQTRLSIGDTSVKGSSVDGVRLDGATTYTAIQGGVFTGNTGYGVNEVNGAVDYTAVFGSLRSGNTGGPDNLPGVHSQSDTVATTTNAGGQTETTIPLPGGKWLKTGQWRPNGGMGEGDQVITFQTPFKSTPITAWAELVGSAASSATGTTIKTAATTTGITITTIGYQSGGISAISGLDYFVIG